jgi:hypothetical protein
MNGKEEMKYGELHQEELATSTTITITTIHSMDHDNGTHVRRCSRCCCRRRNANVWKYTLVLSRYDGSSI